MKLSAEYDREFPIGFRADDPTELEYKRLRDMRPAEVINCSELSRAMHDAAMEEYEAHEKIDAWRIGRLLKRLRQGDETARAEYERIRKSHDGSLNWGVEELRRSYDNFHRAAETVRWTSDLSRLVCDALPDWMAGKYGDMRFAEALERFWPGPR